MTADPPYFEKIRKLTGIKMSPADIERSILRSWKMEWSKNPSSCPYNFQETIHFHRELPDYPVEGWTQHMLRLRRLSFPTLGLDPWVVQKYAVIEKARFTDRRKIINMIGSKNSGKTNFFAEFGLLMTGIDPEFTRTFVAGPYKNAAEAVVWGRMGTRHNQMKNAIPSMWGGIKEQLSRGRYIFEDHDEAGYIELITMDKTGKLQGTKAVDQERGWLILICDEIAEFPSAALKDVLDNLTGNENFMCLTGCNFKNTEGMEGDLCHPEGKEYPELDPERDFEWPSAYKSWTIRFDGHQSPNVLTKKVIYPYLLREEIRKDMEDIHGQGGPKYLEQVRSFPNTSMSDFYVTTREKVRAGGGYDTFTWGEGPEPQKVVFCDPGFGGDPCKIGCFKYGPARIQSIDGQWHTAAIFCPDGPIETIKLDTGMLVTNEWKQRVQEISGKDLLIAEGTKVTLEQQIVVGCYDFLERKGVSKQNFGYDGSMRASIVHEMVALMGSSITSLDFGGQATEREVDARGTIAKDEYSNFVTEMYFNFATTVQAGQFRGADVIGAAIAQIIRRPWLQAGQSRKQIQPKQEYKKDNQGRSPDDADVLVGALEMAIRAGFRGNMRRKASTAIVNHFDYVKKLAQFKVFQRTTAKQLNS